MVDTVLSAFDMAEKHGAVGFHSEGMGFFMNGQPFLCGGFTRTDLLPDVGCENLSPTAGQHVESCCIQARQDLLGGDALNGREVGYFDRSEAFENDVREPFFYRPHDLFKVVKTKLGVAAAHNVDFARCQSRSVDFGNDIVLGQHETAFLAFLALVGTKTQPFMQTLV